MRILSVLLIYSTSLLFYQGTAEKKYVSGTTDYASLKQKKEAMDDYEFKHRKDLIFLIKLEGKKNLVRVKEGDWPDNTEYIYTILKGPTGEIMLIGESPYSQSGDWYIECKHYFNIDGKTFAFSKRESVFDDSVKGGVAMETYSWFYNDKFQIIKNDYRLTDKDDKLIKRNKNEFDFRDFTETIYKNGADCLQAYNIKLEHK